ncbi:MAG: c-type cytochrome [Verrucomicrobiales bacterium]|nr:c-type cytochrome [Verrucomicrobiales bacterium]
MKKLFLFVGIVLMIFAADFCWVTPCLADSAADSARRKDMHYYMKGRHIFRSQCSPCHGKTGRGNGPWAVKLTDKPRDFRVGIFKFRSTPYGKLPTNDDLRRTIRNGISGTAMPFFKKLTDADVNGLIVYLQSLSKRWKDEKNYAEAIPLPKTPAWFKDRQQLAVHSQRGARKFAELCAACHGSKGKGDGLAAKGLIDVWKNPITPADLSNEHHKSGDAPSDLYRTIASGLDGTPMLAFYQTLKEDEIWNLVAFIKHNEVKGQRVDVK